MKPFGTPHSDHALRVLLLGAGELGKEVAIELQRYAVEVIAVDRYANAPAMQVAHRSHVIDMLDGKALRAVIELEKPDLVVPEIEAIHTPTLIELEKEGQRVIPTARAAWLTMGAGLLCWSLGELYFALLVEGSGAATGSISPADGLYLAMYPCLYVAIMLLLGAHLRELRVSLWLDGLIGGLPGPTYIYGEGGGDLLAAGGGCAGGTLDGGPGDDDASFAETQAHPGTLYISLEVGWAWINVVKGCHKVRLPRSDEDIEGSFDNDVLIGDGEDNVMLGQPGVDSYFGRGGNDVIVAADGVKDWYIQCGNKGHPEGIAIVDSIYPEAQDCAKVVAGSTVQGLGKAAHGN